ncbi:hypothetical protein [Lelliottia nimipressuralis]|uniref:Lipoprotein n=1 Tax=Lelliottia nimipressuralis TaxID=69220 RepID=A0ABD4KD30_9ENTR|nr:hypothetical protein [Lelliottia nimipressuralis]MBF4179684.1 hypothetical protein [Lelliottia nimipressuralis]
MKTLLSCLLGASMVLSVAGCAVTTKTAGKETATAFGRGCAVLVDSSTEYSVTCASVDPQKVIQAIKTVKAAKQ